MKSWSVSFLKVILTPLIFYAGSVSCDSASESKPDKTASPAVNKTEFIPAMDSIPFSSIAEIADHFRGAYIDADNKAVAFRKKSEKESMALADSVAIYDSIANEVIRIRSKKMIDFLHRHEKNEQNFLAMQYLVVDRNLSLQVLDSILQSYPVSIRTSKAGKNISEQLQARKTNMLTTDLYRQLKDLPFFTTDHKEVRLKGINTKYVVLDFWAAWCIPCRFENKWITEHSSQLLENKEVTFVAISLDTRYEQWVRISKADKLPQLNISDLKGFDSPIAKKLKIERIPFNIIIDKNGKTLATNLWKDELLSFIKTLH